MGRQTEISIQRTRGTFHDCTSGCNSSPSSTTQWRKLTPPTTCQTEYSHSTTTKEYFTQSPSSVKSTPGRIPLRDIRHRVAGSGKSIRRMGGRIAERHQPGPSTHRPQEPGILYNHKAPQPPIDELVTITFAVQLSNLIPSRNSQGKTRRVD